MMVFLAATSTFVLITLGVLAFGDEKSIGG